MRHPFLRGVLAAALAFWLAGPSPAGDKTPFSRRSPVVEAVQKTQASVVSVRVPRPNGGKDMVGTGVVVDERGFIVTNRHVVGTSQSVKVRLHDGTELPGEVAVADPRCDLAVVRVRPKGLLKALELAPADDLLVGESVIAIGHPYGYSNTVSTGIISALGREITMPTGDTLGGLIQTDAAINPGNSGGPLVNINGELIGINVALRDGAQNIAFAINAAAVKQFLKRHLSAVQVSGVDHGLQCGEKVLAETGDRQRVVVTGPAASADVQSGDEILTVNERQVANAFDIERAFWGRRPGEQVALKVLRQGRELTVTLTLSDGNGAGPVAATSPPAGSSTPRAAAQTSVPASDDQ
jgi:serine protease Do